MSSKEKQYREILEKIATLLKTISPSHESEQGIQPSPLEKRGGSAGVISCVLKALPKRLLLEAARTAHRVNPVNSPILGPLRIAAADLQIMEPQRIALMTSKYWGPAPRQLSVSFMEDATNELRDKIISHMNAWTKTAGISFISFAATSGVGDVRISRGSGGYWSYIGTDILHIPENRPTMNLEDFTLNTPDSEYARVVRHETGHTLGFPHEHMRKELVARIDPKKAYDYFWKTQGWPKDVVDAQVLTSLDDASIMGTPVDQTSIMCYQLPGSITTDGEPIVGGLDINDTDYAFAGKIYPKSGAVSGTTETPSDDWDPSEDRDPRI